MTTQTSTNTQRQCAEGADAAGEQAHQVASTVGSTNISNRRQLPTIRDSKTSGPVTKRRSKASQNYQLQKLGRGLLQESQPEQAAQDAIEVFSFKEKQQVKSFSSRQSILGVGPTYGKFNNDLTKSSHTARADAALLSIETSQRISEPIDLLIIEQTQRERSKTTKNEQARIIGSMDYHQLQHKLCTREAGATLNNDGLPFYLEQMHKERLIKANKTHKLRLGLQNSIMQNMQSHCQPRAGSYILDRMLANQKLMNKYRDKHKLYKTPKDFTQNFDTSKTKRLPFARTLGTSPKGFAINERERVEFSPIETDIKHHSSQNRHNESFIKNSEQMTEQINEEANQTIVLGQKTPNGFKGKDLNASAIEPIQSPQGIKISSHNSKLRGRATGQHEHQDGLQIGSKMTSHMSNVVSHQSAQHQINESSIDGIKRLSMTVTHKEETISHPELNSQRKNQMIQDVNDQDLLKKQMKRKSQNYIPQISTQTQNRSKPIRMQGATIIHIQAPSSPAGTKSKVSPSAVSQSLKQTSYDKKRPSPKFESNINSEALAQQLPNKEKESNELNVKGVNKNIKQFPVRIASPKQYQPIQLKIQRLSDKNLRAKHSKTASIHIPAGPYKLDQMSDAQMLAYEQLQRNRCQFTRNLRQAKYLRESHQRNKAMGYTVYSMSPSTHRRDYYGGSNGSDFDQMQFMGQTTFSQIGSLLEDQGSSNSRGELQREQELPRPVFVIGKKPQSIVVNYKSSSGHNLVKVSQGDPQFKIIIQNQQKMQDGAEVANDENETSKEESNFGVPRSEQANLQQTTQQSDPQQIKKNPQMIESGEQSLLKRVGSSNLKKIKLEYKELSKSRTNAKSALDSSGSNLRPKDASDQVAETPQPLPPLSQSKVQHTRIHINEIINSPILQQKVDQDAEKRDQREQPNNLSKISNIKVVDSPKDSSKSRSRRGYQVKKIKEVHFKARQAKEAADPRTGYSKSLPRNQHQMNSLRVALSPRFRLQQNKYQLRESKLSSELRQQHGAATGPANDWNSFKDFELLNFENLNINYVPSHENQIDQSKQLINIDQQKMASQLSRKTDEVLLGKMEEATRINPRNGIATAGHMQRQDNTMSPPKLRVAGLPQYFRANPRDQQCNLKDLSVITTEANNQTGQEAQVRPVDTRNESITQTPPNKSNNRMVTDPASFGERELNQMQLQDKIYIQTAQMSQQHDAQLAEEMKPRQQSSNEIAETARQEAQCLHSEMGNTLLEQSQDMVGRNDQMIQKYN